MATTFIIASPVRFARAIASTRLITKIAGASSLRSCLFGFYLLNLVLKHATTREAKPRTDEVNHTQTRWQ
jgi:hypothetical protein